MSRFRTALLALVGASVVVAGLLGVAGPAMAAGCSGTTCSAPVTVQATVAEAVTITGIGSPINFGSVQPGVPALATPDPAEVYTVATNAPHGYALALNWSGVILMDASSDAMPNDAISIQEKGAAPGTFSLTNGTGPHSHAIDTTAAGGQSTYSESWTLTAPANQPAGNYTGSVTYTAIANP